MLFGVSGLLLLFIIKYAIRMQKQSNYCRKVVIHVELFIAAFCHFDFLFLFMGLHIPNYLRYGLKQYDIDHKS